MKVTYIWHGEEKKVVNTMPLQAQAFLALLEDKHILQRVWMKEQNNKTIHEFRDNTGYKSFRFDMQTKSKQPDGYYYCIQMQSNRGSESSSVLGIPNSWSYCDVKIHEKAAPSPTVFRDACWSSAAESNVQKGLGNKPKTMSVIIHADNTWINEETREQGFDEAARAEARRKDHIELEAKIMNNSVTGEDFKKVYGNKKKK